jgi:hypothetical protein
MFFVRMNVSFGRWSAGETAVVPQTFLDKFGSYVTVLEVIDGQGGDLSAKDRPVRPKAGPPAREPARASSLDGGEDRPEPVHGEHGEAVSDRGSSKVDPV